MMASDDFLIGWAVRPTPDVLDSNPIKNIREPVTKNWISFTNNRKINEEMNDPW